MDIEEIEYYCKPLGVEHHFSLTAEIEDPAQFSSMLATLREATPEDCVYIHINSPGGCVYTTVQIINAMKECKAPVITCAEGMVASGAALIFFSGHGFTIGGHCEFLVHTASGGGAAKISDTASMIKFTTKWVEEMYADVLGPFLTSKELKRVAKGEEFYLTSKQVHKRITKFVEEQNEETE